MPPPTKPSPQDQWLAHPSIGVQAGNYPAAGGAGTNPFDAPEAQIQIEKYALPVIQQLAVQQAQNAARDFSVAITKVKDAKKAQAAAEQAQRDMVWTIAITIALMPAGPIAEAAGTAIAGSVLQGKMMAAIVNNAEALEAKFGAKGAQAANKAFDLVASDAVSNMAKKFDAAKATSALNAGVDLLKGQAVKFAASSDRTECVTNYLDAMLKLANDAMHNLTDYIQTTQSYSEALAFYNYFSKPLQGIYEAVLGQQADDMLSEVADVMAKNAKSGISAAMSIGKEDDIVKVQAYGRMRFAHIRRFMKPDSITDSYDFVKWVTPDMEPMAVKLATEELDSSSFENHLPDPQREPGERIVLVDGWGRERLMLVDIDDEGIYWKDYGVLTFKKWPQNEEEEKAFRSRGAMQNGGIDRVDLKTIKSVKAPTG